MFTEPIETSSMNYVIMESHINKDFIDLINKSKRFSTDNLPTDNILSLLNLISFFVFFKTVIFILSIEGE